MSVHPWIKSYPPGVRWDAPIPSHPVAGFLDAALARWPDQPFLDFVGRRFSYREFDALVSRAAKGLQLLGVRPGVHVGLYLPNTPHYPITFFGVMRAGGTVVNYSPLDAERMLEHKVEDSDTDFLVTLDLDALYPPVARLLATTRLKKLIVGNVAEMSAAGAQGKAPPSKIPADAGHMSFAQLLDNDGAFEPHSLADPASAVAVLQYTGGTTGLPKGAMLTHANLSAACAQYWETLQAVPRLLEDGRERYLVVLPLFHIYSLTVNLLLGMRIGAELVLHTRFDLEAVVRDLVGKRISVFPAVPTMYSALVGRAGVEQLDLSALKVCNSGGAPLPGEVHARFKQLTGCTIAEGWGMTETSPSGTFTPRHGGGKPGSCGMPAPGIGLKLVDLEDPAQAVAPGQRGEICVKGPNLMKGYWKNPEATAESMTPDGFFRTGDVATMDEDGYVFIVDRIKDMLLCGGFNVYPRVIEEAIHEHADVAAVCVIGIADAYRGQSPKAFVVLKPGAQPLTLDALKAFLKDRLGKHEMVQTIELRAELPKTAVGKISKRTLIDEEASRGAAPTQERAA